MKLFLGISKKRHAKNDIFFNCLLLDVYCFVWVILQNTHHGIWRYSQEHLLPSQRNTRIWTLELSAHDTPVKICEKSGHCETNFVTKIWILDNFRKLGLKLLVFERTVVSLAKVLFLYSITGSTLFWWNINHICLQLKGHNTERPSDQITNNPISVYFELSASWSFENLGIDLREKSCIESIWDLIFSWTLAWRCCSIKI